MTAFPSSRSGLHDVLLFTSNLLCSVHLSMLDEVLVRVLFRPAVLQYFHRLPPLSPPLSLFSFPPDQIIVFFLKSLVVNSFIGQALLAHFFPSRRVTMDSVLFVCLGAFFFWSLGVFSFGFLGVFFFFFFFFFVFFFCLPPPPLSSPPSTFLNLFSFYLTAKHFLLWKMNNFSKMHFFSILFLLPFF